MQRRKDKKGQFLFNESKVCLFRDKPKPEIVNVDASPPRGQGRENF